MEHDLLDIGCSHKGEDSRGNGRQESHCTVLAFEVIFERIMEDMGSAMMVIVT